ncbi:MAG: RNA polymerase sigma-70 factor [Proteiniphilum sp.]|nr:RNA polymerase sigma-70 factor [Proteiniphilum sp.]
MYDEKLLLKKLRQGDEKAFTSLFRKYYRDLVMFAGSYLLERDVCEDIVQTVFVNVWDKRKDLNYEVSFRSFLLTSVKNSCLDELRHRKVITKHQQNYDVLWNSMDMSTEQHVLYSELKSHLDKALSLLPKKQRKVFEMSRLHGTRYKDIARQLNISERTVEDRMAKTMKLLINYLKDYLPFLIILHFLQS